MAELTIDGRDVVGQVLFFQFRNVMANDIAQGDIRAAAGCALIVPGSQSLSNTTKPT